MSQEYKGGKVEALKRYREKNKELLRERHRAEYQRNKERYKEFSSKYRKENKDAVNAYNREYGRKFRARIRAEMILAYGKVCSCCGEAEPMFLELDHINNDGAKNRKLHGNQFQEWLFLQKQAWPKENHQLLCANCNKGKAKNGGICPHQTKNRS